MNNAKTITIPLKEYKKLINLATKGVGATYRIKKFSKYVHSEKYNIDRQECGAFFDFEVSADE